MTPPSVRRVLLCGLLMASLAVGLTGFASAASGLSPAAADCNQHATLTRAYTVTQLRTALATMPADVAEYTDCHDVIEHQLLAQLSAQPGGGPGGGGGSFLPLPVMIVLILLGLAAAGFAGLAIRQRLAA